MRRAAERTLLAQSTRELSLLSILSYFDFVFVFELSSRSTLTLLSCAASPSKHCRVFVVLSAFLCVLVAFCTKARSLSQYPSSQTPTRTSRRAPSRFTLKKVLGEQQLADDARLLRENVSIVRAAF
jgi:hypothetical protein